MTAMLSLGSSHTFRAMGVTCSVTVVAPHPFPLIDVAVDRVNRFEQLWSRFLPTSDITRLNQAGGLPTRVADETVTLIAHMQEASAATSGYFNPTLLPLQMAAGDVDSLNDNLHTSDLPPTAVVGTASRLREITISDGNELSLPVGLTLDAGGIGKGLAADLVAEHLLAAGAEAVAVNLGGDVRIASTNSSLLDWPVTVASHHVDPETSPQPLAVLSLRRGAVATSVRAARRRDRAGIDNHIFSLDPHPRTDRNSVIGATVVASTAAWAEAWTKHAILAPVEATIAEIDALDLAVMIVHADGSTHTSRNWERYAQ